MGRVLSYSLEHTLPPKDFGGATKGREWRGVMRSVVERMSHRLGHEKRGPRAYNKELSDFLSDF